MHLRWVDEDGVACLGAGVDVRANGHDGTHPPSDNAATLKAMRTKVPPHERALSRIEITPDDCWRYLGYKDKDGYGLMRGVAGKTQLAHRVVYEALVAPIPPGLQLDHLCRVRDCLNPKHLEPVTLKENIRRGRSSNSEKTHCPQGHPYSGENLWISATTGARLCATCTRETWKRKWLKKKVGPKPRQTECGRGHPYTIYPNGRRRCLECENTRARELRQGRPTEGNSQIR